MNGPQLKKSGMYDMLSIVVNKPTNTLKKYFSRNKLDITNKNHVNKYLYKYYQKRYLNGSDCESKKIENKMSNIFRNMLNRCNNKKYYQYYLYGGRGIKCKWRTLTDFLYDMSPTYQEGLSIDRIDNNGNYCKENCRWADRKTQANNKRNNVIVEGGLTLAQWCEKNSIGGYQVIARKYHKKGKPLSDILEIIREKSKLNT